MGPFFFTTRNHISRKQKPETTEPIVLGARIEVKVVFNATNDTS